MFPEKYTTSRFLYCVGTPRTCLKRTEGRARLHLCMQASSNIDPSLKISYFSSKKTFSTPSLFFCVEYEKHHQLQGSASDLDLFNKLTFFAAAPRRISCVFPYKYFTAF